MRKILAGLALSGLLTTGAQAQISNFPTSSAPQPPIPGFRSGAVYHGPLTAIGTGAALNCGGTTASICFEPIYLPAGTSITSFIVKTATCATGNAKAALYSTSAGLPSSLLAATPSSTTVGTNTESPLTITGGPYVVPTTAWYWLAFTADNATCTFISQTTGDVFASNYIGGPTLGATAGTSSLAAGWALTTAQTYTNAFPSTTGPLTLITVNNQPIVGIKIT